MKASKFILASILMVFLVALNGCGNGDGPPPPPPAVNVEYEVTIENPSNHEMSMELVIYNLGQGSLTIARPMNSLDFLPAVSEISVRNEEGLPLGYAVRIPEGNQSERISILSEGEEKVIVEYKVDLTFTEDSSHWKLDEDFGIVESQIIFYQPFDVIVDEAKAKFHLPDGWTVVSRFNPLGDYYKINNEDMVAYDTEEYFIWGPIAFGDFSVYEQLVGDTNVRVAFYANESIQEAVANNIFSIIQYGQNSIGSLTNIPSLNVCYAYVPPLSGDFPFGISARDHILGDFRVLSDDPLDGRHPQMKYREIAHTIFHTFFSHFDFDLWDTIFVHMWLSEGIIQFYALKSLEQTGIWDVGEVHNELINWYNNYSNYVLGTEYDLPVYPESNWADFLDPFRSYIWYEKEPLIFWLLDYKIKDVTGEQRSFDDVWKYFHDQQPGNENAPISYDEILNACNNTSGHDFTLFFNTYVSGNTELPYYVEDDMLIIDDSMIPPIPPL